MRILYIITGLGCGGAETVTVDIANQMSRRGHKVAILYLTGDNMFGDTIDATIEVKAIGMGKTFRGFFNAIRKTRGFLNQFAPDVVHAQMVHANIFARLLRVTCKIPRLICTEHTINIEGRARLIAYRITDFLSDINTNVSSIATSFLIEKKAFSKKKSITVYNGVDCSKFSFDSKARSAIRAKHRIADDQFLFLNVGRLTEPKDRDTLLSAFALTQNSKLLIVGDGLLRDCIVKKIKQLNIEDRVIMAGAQRNIPEYCSAADCFVLSSSWEGFPIVLIEAMSCGLPVISTNAGGCAEAVQDKNYIVPIKDPKALSKVMSDMENLTIEQRHAIGENSLLLAKTFDIKTICSQWENIYMSN